MATPIDFPSNPAVGSKFTAPNSVVYQWTGVAWVLSASVTRALVITVGTDPPPDPVVGDQWWNTVNGQLFVWYNDGTSAQWVVANRYGPTVITTVEGAVDLAALGIASDGTDKTALLNSIFMTYGAAAYRLNKVGTGTMLTTGVVNMPNGGVVTMADDVVWEAHQIRFDGTIGTAQPLTARVAIEEIVFPFDTAGIAVDDWIYVFGCTNLGSADAGAEQLTWSADLSPNLPIYPGQFFRAQAVSPTAITAQGGARWDYEITPGPDSRTRTVSQAWKVNFITGGIRGGTIKAWSGSTDSIVVNLIWAREVFLEGVHFDLMAHDTGNAVRIQKSLMCRVSYCKATRRTDAPVPPVTPARLRNSFRVEGSQQVDFSYNHAIGGTQAFDVSIATDSISTSPCFDCSITNNTIVSANQGGTSHPGSTNIRIDSNHVTNCRTGILIRTTRSSANFNTVINESGVGVGINLYQGFFGGTTVIGNTIVGFQQAITVDFRSTGAPLPLTVHLIDNVIRSPSHGYYVIAHATIRDAVSKAIIIRGGSVSAARTSWTTIGAYSHGLSIDGVTFAGTPGLQLGPGIIRIPANTTDVHIGTNYFRDTGTTPCIWGPGLTALTDTTVFPAGEVSAKWTIKEQKLLGNSSGPQSANMPISVAAYAYAPTTPLLRINELGKLLGSNASFASTILSSATTVQHIAQAINQLLYPPADLAFVSQFDFTSGTMPGGAALTRASVGWSLNAAGVLVSNAVNAARFHYNSTGTLRGLLNEPSQSNTLYNSQTLIGALRFALRAATQTLDALAAPTGAVTAGKLVEDTTTDSHAVNCFPSISLTAGADYMFSVFAKAGERTVIRLSFVTGFMFSTAQFDLVAGAVVSTAGGPVTARITAYPNGWYHCSATLAAAASGGASASISLVADDAVVITPPDDDGPSLFTLVNDYLGDGVSGCYLWGAQFSAGTSGSYIDTTAAIVTRAADVLTLTVANGSYNIDFVRESGTTLVPGVVVSTGTYVVPSDPSPLQKIVLR